jgi:hypothetical protein
LRKSNPPASNSVGDFFWSHIEDEYCFFPYVLLKSKFQFSNIFPLSPAAAETSLIVEWISGKKPFGYRAV